VLGAASSCLYDLSGSSHRFLFNVSFTADESSYSLSNMRVRVSYQVKGDLASFVERFETWPVFSSSF